MPLGRKSPGNHTVWRRPGRGPALRGRCWGSGARGAVHELAAAGQQDYGLSIKGWDYHAVLSTQESTSRYFVRFGASQSRKGTDQLVQIQRGIPKLVMAGAVALQGEARDRLAQPGAKTDPGGLKAAPSTCREVVEKREPEGQGASAGPSEGGSNGT